MKLDPILSVQSYEDIDSLSAAIVDAAIKQTADDYWQAKVRPLNSSLITAALMTTKGNKSPGMADVLKLFNQLLPREKGSSVEPPLDRMFECRFTIHVLQLNI